MRWLPHTAPKSQLSSYELWLRQISNATSADNSGTGDFVAVCYLDLLASADGANAAANVFELPISELMRGLVAYTAHDLRVAAVGCSGLRPASGQPRPPTRTVPLHGNMQRNILVHESENERRYYKVYIVFFNRND